nr:reverse transcriptase domain-containing protein [Tanacetum cinerariifolium]
VRNWIDLWQRHVQFYVRCRNLVTDIIKRDKIQAKPSTKRKAWKSQPKSTPTKSKPPNQKVKRNKVRGAEFAKSCMRTHSSSNLPVESPPNPPTSNPKRRNRRRSKQPFVLEESPADTMADQRTLAELLRAPTEGYAEAIVVPSILAEQFELKHSLINMMTSD